MSNPPSNFPEAFDTDANIKTVADNIHDVIALHHNIEKNCIKAIEEKLGIDGSTDITSIDYLLKNAGSVDPGHTHTGLGNHTLDDPIHTDIAVITEAQGMLLLRGATEWEGFPKGTNGQLLKAGATTIAWEDIDLEDLNDIEAITKVEGDLLYVHEVATILMWRKLARGNDGQFLKSTTTSIQWANLTSLPMVWNDIIDIKGNDQTGKIYITLPNASMTVKMKMWGQFYRSPANADFLKDHQHASGGSHSHNLWAWRLWKSTREIDTHEYSEGAWYSGWIQSVGGHQHAAASAGSGLTTTDVPKTVEIWIDGVDRTSALGGPWGDGVAEFASGELDISSYVSSSGEHYIEIKETGAVGGRIQYELRAN